jgi:hypothetical protein
MKSYRCPVCKKVLTKREYERALGILGERERHLKHQTDELQRQLRQAQSKVRKARADGVNAGVSAERARTQRLLQGKDKEIGKLKERIDQLKKGSSPQTEGLEFEEKLTVRLKREFPDDDIQHKGKAGDVLHLVKYEKKQAGVIIYECKRVPRIQTQHIAQAFLAKQSREADFAVLVTTGQKKGFSGLAQMDGVLVVSPLGAIPLAALLRAHLIEMLRVRITGEQRAAIAQKLMKYITSPQFKNPIEEVVHLTSQLQDMIKEEAKEHFRVWKKRWDRYQTINWDGSHIQENLRLVLHGKEPRAIVHQKALPLQLPAIAG